MLAAPVDYSASLAAVLPAVARSLGSITYAEAPSLGIAPTRRAVVVLIDGLGHHLLARRTGHAPFLRSLLSDGLVITCGFPSTTATSMGSFGTGRPPGQHGLMGYEVLDPEADRVLNELSWRSGEAEGPDPRTWQPLDTVFEVVSREGVQVTRIGPAYFDGSGLTNAALRGGRFLAADSLDSRVALAVQAAAASPRTLTYLYWGDLDKVGHVFGVGAMQWGQHLEEIDRALATLAERVPADTAIYVTADHGMVDAPFERRVDLAGERDLLAGVRHLAGEPRSVQLYCEPGATADVAAAWTGHLGRRAVVSTRQQVVDSGLVGTLRDGVGPRLGDIVVNMTHDYAVVHSGRTRKEVLALVGLHGSTTPEELDIPLLTVPARTR